MSELTCQTCGDRFEPPAHLRERYPGWEPPECPRCYRGDRAGDAPGEQLGGDPGSDGGASDGPLRPVEVLERYEAGPDTGVFTDGGASPNPGPGGWGAVYVVDGEIVDQAYGHEPDTTNNRMELTALARGIELVPAGRPTTIYSDSRLVVQSMREWAEGWKRRGWKRRTGPVENLDLVRPLYERLQARPELELEWIRAHTGLRWNEYADALANLWRIDPD